MPRASPHLRGEGVQELEPWCPARTVALLGLEWVSWAESRVGDPSQAFPLWSPLGIRADPLPSELHHLLDTEGVGPSSQVTEWTQLGSCFVK